MTFYRGKLVVPVALALKPWRVPGLATLAALVVVILGAKAVRADCNALADPGARFVDLPGAPFSTMVSRDGCWVFVAVMQFGSGGQNGVAVLRREGNANVRVQNVVPLKAGATGMVITHDGKLLIAATNNSVVFVDVEKAIAQNGDAVLGEIVDQPDAGSVYVNVSRDDKFLFVSDEAKASVSVLNLAEARRTGFTQKSVFGRIPSGRAPIALTFSPDEKYLYMTAEAAMPDWNWPPRCTPEGRGGANVAASVPEGAVLVVSVAKAETDPTNSVLAKIPAGCSPVRMSITEDGSAIWLTVRNNNAVESFDTGKLLTDPDHARVAWVPVGTAPVGLAITHDGKYVLATNSNRFGADANAPQTVTVIDRARGREGALAIIGAIQAGAFPREFGVSPDGKTIFLANFLSKTLELVDAEHLPLKEGGK